MGSSADRAAVLVQAIEATVAGDSRVVRDLYADDVQGWSPVMTVSSAAELAVELEDRQEAFSEIDLEVTPLDVGDDQACVEWIATATHSGPLVVDEEVVIEPTGGGSRCAASRSPTSRATAFGLSANTGTKSHCSSNSSCFRRSKAPRVHDSGPLCPLLRARRTARCFGWQDALQTCEARRDPAYRWRACSKESSSSSRARSSCGGPSFGPVSSRART